MFIERIQVEEGFLNGLDVRFTSGLNAIIGARGTGKTSLIELIRFCLNVPANTLDVSKKSREHALSILGSGQVTVTVNVNGQSVHITRTNSDEMPRSSGFYAHPLIFSQKEIETIGLEATGRLKLIDSFVNNTLEDATEEKKKIAEIASLTTEINKKTKEIDEIDEISRQIPNINEQLESVIQLEKNLASTSTVLNTKTEKLNSIASEISSLSVLEVNNKRAQLEIEKWYRAIHSSYEHTFGELDSNPIYAEYKNIISKSQRNLYDILIDINSIYDAMSKKAQELSHKKLEIESRSRTLRQEVEQLQAGSGEILRKGQDLRERKARYESYKNLLDFKKNELITLKTKRSLLFDTLETVRSGKFNKRLSISSALNRKLNPNINIKILRNAQYNNFTSYLMEVLKGSGIKYNEIAPSIASSLSPRALLEAVDNFDVELITVVANISTERATRLLAHLRSSDLSSLSSVTIEDDATLQLLDGNDYKNISLLSTGQRCSVILPIVLAHNDKILIVDQPEDHIDNAFITSTLIKSLLARGNDGQIIFSTHNPNIPVLGNADNVIHLGSDGRNGFVLSQGNLEDNKVVNAITTVMEGGEEAFSLRSQFYSKSKF
ncbi:AAA family ATPase [Enterobacter ludwigii]|uniref:AAA family ATPase n=1 Tax=Enterobacter ludwigii TaxID=299767 RepID=UPI002B4BB321|nr:hypothetical protein [Enterobacter ludwigii]WRM15349.1 hypothetical protein SOP92_10025 [Enterobacter ludwigii]